MGQSKYSNYFKSICISGGCLDYAKQQRKEFYRAYQENDLEKVFTLYDFFHRDTYIDCSLRLLESEYRKYLRLYKKINYIVSLGGSVFITLTFRDDVLNSTSAETRRRYVSRYLKENCSFYIANIDFSPDKDREHYHAVIGSRCDFSKWSYGFVFAEEVRTHDFDARRVSRYVAKLTNHALKVKSVSSRLIYSRNVI